MERMARRGWAAPRSALQLVRERLYAFNAVALGYVMWPRWTEGSSTLQRGLSSAAQQAERSKQASKEVSN